MLGPGLPSLKDGSIDGGVWGCRLHAFEFRAFAVCVVVAACACLLIVHVGWHSAATRTPAQLVMPGLIDPRLCCCRPKGSGPA